MGFSNGLLSLKSEKNQKGDKGERGVGFKLTADRHFHLEDRRLTNLAPPVHKNDPVTKGHLTDVLKAKAGTNYVSLDSNVIAEYFEGSSQVIVKGRLKANISFWQSIGASKFILDT